MDPTAQRIAIAKACNFQHTVEASDHFEARQKLFAAKKAEPHSLPDYLNDLNAMHEAESKLTRLQFDDYHMCLEALAHKIHGSVTYAVRLTALEKAECFLRTLGLWKDQD